ncbi:type VII secretion-associated serine protease mycosin [Streptomyces sp. NPDC003077]|uniref:type VII secretion-associated serine protease mycosin n=1 Tax=Streptomyces sp. NPDC003077 TaxID=3154443 RepID=UPI0033B81B84
MSLTRALRTTGCAVVTGALFVGTAPVASADQIRQEQWALVSLQAEKVWQESTGKGVTVAVIDSGINGNHPDLRGNVLPGKNFSTGDPADQETKNDHGTAIASIIAGHGHGPAGSLGVKGLAPDAKILAIKDTDTDGNSYRDGVAGPLRYAVDHGAKVVNMSFAGVGSLRDDEKEAIAYAAKKDVLLVAGAGNNGSANPYYPAAEPGVLAVGAVDKNGKVWERSNYGPHLLLSAPGVTIRSAAASESYQLTRGTSDATAFVSGAAALLRAKFPELTAGQIANRLTRTARMPTGVSGSDLPDPYYGYGVIRPYEALTDDIPAGSKNGPLKEPEAQSDGQAAKTQEERENQWAAEDAASDTSAVLGIIGFSCVVLLVIGGIVLLVVRRKKKRRDGPPPGGPGVGGPGGPGYFPPQPGPYQQSGPYQQQPGPYQPPAPPNRPPTQ